MTDAPPSTTPSRSGCVVAGVDEAGLGPLVGPLTIGYSAFRLPAPNADPWRLLRRTVTAEPEKDDKRLAVADSKRVFARTPRGRRRLECTALTFLALLREDARPPTSALELVLGTLSPGRERLACHPWYARLPKLPMEMERQTLELRADVLRRDLAGRGIEFLQAGVRVVPAGELNDSYAETNNKAATVWSKTLEVLRHLWLAYGEERPSVTVDILGGRLRYGPLLARGFQDASVSWSREVSGHAAYRLEERDPPASRPARGMRLDFRAKGEDHSFAVALASCLAKYTRELVMQAFNGYFRELDPKLKPTAGYRTDGWRWMREAQGALRKAGLKEHILVRQR